MLQDVIALVIQSIGGASASSANTHVEAQKGANIALGEYIFRLPATDCLSQTSQAALSSNSPPLLCICFSLANS